MEMKSVKLYHFAASRSARARWILHETLGDGFEIERLNLYRNEQHAPEFLALNPSHSVPVLEIEWSDGTQTHMKESAAMVAFLADAFPEKKLAPPANCLLYTSPSPRDLSTSRMPSSA